MKKIFNIAVAALALFGAIACNTTSVDEVVESQNVVTASFVESRTALVDGVKTVWSADDKIDVNGVTFSLTSGAGESAAVFTSAQPVEVAQSYTATYPAGVTVVPTTQSAVAGSFDPAAALAVATNSSLNNMLFEYKHALVKFSLPADAAKVELLGYTLTGELKRGTTYYIAIAAGQYDGVVAKVDGVVVKQGQSALNAVNGKIYNLGVLEAEAVQGPGIRTAADLVAFAAEVEAQIAAGQTADGGEFKDASGVVNILANIDMKGVAWTPISNFAGTLEGNNKTIDNLVVENATHAAMFKNLSGATVQNLVFGKGCSFTVTGTGTTYAGAVVGQILTGATIKNVKNYGPLSAGSLMGGICGAANLKKANILFEDCTNFGSVTFPAITATSDVKIGGMVGASESKVTIRNCTNKGKITDLSTGGNKYNQIGGIVGGYGDSLITGCTNTGDFKCDVRGSNNIYYGGIIGRAYRINIENTTNSGSFELTPETSFTNLYLGGIAGSNEGNTSNNIALKGCSNSGNITVDNNNFTGNMAVGGILGWHRVEGCQIENNSNSGNITVSTKIMNKTSDAKNLNHYAGGIIGLVGIANNTGIDKPASVSKCTNSGTIKFTEDESNGIYFYVAGIVGSANSSSKDLFSIVECTNTGEIQADNNTRCYPAGIISDCNINVTGCVNRGKIYTTDRHVDYFGLSAGIVSCLQSDVTISNCKNYGPIVYNGKGFNKANANKGIVGHGGIVAKMVYGTVDGCENYGAIVSNDYDSSHGKASYVNAKGSIAGWVGEKAAVTIKNCKVGGVVGNCVLTDADFGAAKATPVTAENYEDYIYGGDVGKGVTVTDCSFAVSE